MARDAYLRAGVGSAHWPSLALALSQVGAAGAATAPLPGLRHPVQVTLSANPESTDLSDTAVAMPANDTMPRFTPGVRSSTNWAAASCATSTARR